MRAYSKEFRFEVLAACDAGGKTRAVAQRFHVSEVWVRRIQQERREQDQTAPCTTRRRTPIGIKEAESIRAAIVHHNRRLFRPLGCLLDERFGLPFHPRRVRVLSRR